MEEENVYIVRIIKEDGYVDFKFSDFEAAMKLYLSQKGAQLIGFKEEK
ncbi:MAG: hypothetical protein IJO01_08500 [Oscillospiraceae bacterium]|nr:hypothetical protein [Oscillospiraceae bacterium]